jgi:hypothetical protein
MGDGLLHGQTEFGVFLGAARKWLVSAPHPDVGLAAAADLLEQFPDLEGHDVACILADASDAHAVLGATTILQLWRWTV